MFRKFLILSLTLGVWGCDTEDDVEDGELRAHEEMPEHPHGMKHKNAGHLLEKLDADRSGTISKDEANDHRWLARKFEDADKDGDGELTRDEIIEFKREHHGKGHHGKGHHGKRMAEHFAELDVNNDGVLSGDEIQDAEKLAKLDADGDAKVTKDELETFVKKHHHGKKGHRFEGSPEEHVAEVFTKYDADDDDVITVAEADGSRFGRKFDKLDGNGDGKVTREELTTAVREHQAKWKAKHEDK